MEKHSEFRFTRRVHFHETDAAGIVHFSRYLLYMEEAEHALWRSAGLSIAPLESEFGWPRVAVSCEYRHPLRFEDEFEVWIRVVGMSDKSMRYVCVLTLGPVHIATLTMTTVCVSKRPDEPMRAVPLPELMRERFEVSSHVVA